MAENRKLYHDRWLYTGCNILRLCLVKDNYINCDQADGCCFS